MTKLKQFFIKHCLWFLTLALVVGAVLCMFIFPSDKLSDYGSVFAAVAGFIAVIWFYNGLQLQSKQLEEQQKQITEQREQFQLEFNNLRIESKRNAMLVARDILSDMEPRVVAKLGGEIDTMPSMFIHFLQFMNPITKSDDPAVVLAAVKSISIFLIPARIFMYAMREAGMCILENEGYGFQNPEIALNGAPEHYINANYNLLMHRPFISRYIATAGQLAKLMSGFDLRVVNYATFAALELQGKQTDGGSYILTDEGIADLRKWSKNHKTPIIEKYLATLPKK
jgi:hypothetical protein